MPHRLKRLTSAAFALFLTTGILHAADQADADRAASWEPVIVLSGNAQVFAGDKPGPKIPPGTLLYISQRKDDWLLVPKYNSWLHEQHARSLPTALAFLNEQIKRQPTSELHHYRANVLSELGRTDEALQDFDAAIAGGTDSSNVFLNRGLCWGRAGDADKALADFKVALDRDDKNAHVYFNRGAIQAQENAPAAIEDFNRAIELEPTYAEAFNNRGVAYQSLGQLDRALEDFEAALKLRPRFPSALTNRALLKQLSGDFTGAITDYGAALRMAPDSHPTLNDLAWLLATCPDEHIRSSQAALQYAERANKLTQDKESDYLDTLAAAAAAAGDFERAVRIAKQAIELSPPESKAEIESRLALYQDDKAFVDVPPADAGEATPSAEAAAAEKPADAKAK